MKQTLLFVKNMEELLEIESQLPEDMFMHLYNNSSTPEYRILRIVEKEEGFSEREAQRYFNMSDGGMYTFKRPVREDCYLAIKDDRIVWAEPMGNISAMKGAKPKWIVLKKLYEDMKVTVRMEDHEEYKKKWINLLKKI